MASTASVLEPDAPCGVLGLDPRTHIFCILAISAASLAIVSFVPLALLQVVAVAYLALNGHARLALQCAASFVVVWLLSMLPIPGLYGVLFVSLLHMLPPFTCACTLFCAPPSAIMCSFARWHVPPNVLIGMCMAFRFMTVLPQEASSILQGIRMRGIFPRKFDLLLHPALAYECFYTPLVMRVLRLSSEQAASSELRGIDADEKRTSFRHVGFTNRDAASIAAVVVCVAAVLLLDVVI
ncbi:MAG: cobalt transporter [Eggerthellaceae bacterium]|nr:cobalt transporter [Eggerthellaceae bacterium]